MKEKVKPLSFNQFLNMLNNMDGSERERFLQKAMDHHLENAYFATDKDKEITEENFSKYKTDFPLSEAIPAKMYEYKS